MSGLPVSVWRLLGAVFIIVGIIGLHRAWMRHHPMPCENPSPDAVSVGDEREEPDVNVIQMGGVALDEHGVIIHYQQGDPPR